jgi:hypothetical protein
MRLIYVVVPNYWISEKCPSDKNTILKSLKKYFNTFFSVIDGRGLLP